MSVQVYDLNSDCDGISAEERQAIAWPVAMWRCNIPENIESKINALEKLILSLIAIGNVDVREVLCFQVGLDRTLVNTAIEECKAKGYINKRSTVLTLNQEGECMLSEENNAYSEDQKMSKNLKVIYLFQDLVTQSVIPCFNIKNKPVSWEYFEDGDIIRLRYPDVKKEKPKTASIESSLRYWSRISKWSSPISEPQATVKYEPSGQDDLVGFDPSEDDIDWRDLNETDGEETVTMADKEAKEQAESERVDVLTIYDDHPEIIYLKAFVAIDVDNVNEPIVISPFGNLYDNWFRTIFRRLRVADTEFADEIDLFIEDRKEVLADKIAFNNDLEIELFDRFPVICNAPKYSGLKASISDLYKAKNRYFDGDTETGTRDLNVKFGTALQSLLKEVLKSHSSLIRGKKLDFEDYKLKIKSLRQSYPALTNDAGIRGYEENFRLYKNAQVEKADKAYATSCIALMLLDANDNPKGKSMMLLHAYPEFVSDIAYVAGERNKIDHANEGFEKIKYKPEEVKSKFETFEKIVTSIYGYFLEEA